MDVLVKPITLTFQHRVLFTRGAFAPENRTLLEVLSGKVLVFVDAGVQAGCPDIGAAVASWMGAHRDHVSLVGGEVLVMPGGEGCKNDWAQVEALWAAINRVGLDHVLLVKVASTAVTAKLMGANREQLLSALRMWLHR